MTISPLLSAALGGVGAYVLAKRGDLEHVGDPSPLVAGVLGAVAGGWLLPMAVAAIPASTTTTTTTATTTPTDTSGDTGSGA